MRRPGYTLMEMALVVALIAAVGALAYPSIDSFYQNLKVRAATDTVRAGWLQARAYAIEHGRTYRFAIVPGEGHVRVAPDQESFWNGLEDGTVFSEGEAPPFIFEETLPKGVRIRVNNGEASSIDLNADVNTTTNIADVAPTQWVPITVFYPDGTARDDVSLVCEVGGSPPLTVSLRALTGSCAVQQGIQQDASLQREEPIP